MNLEWIPVFGFFSGSIIIKRVTVRNLYNGNEFTFIKGGRYRIIKAIPFIGAESGDEIEILDFLIPGFNREFVSVSLVSEFKSTLVGPEHFYHFQIDHYEDVLGDETSDLIAHGYGV